MIVTHERSLALQFVRDIRGELEGNARILAEYGDLCSDEATKRSAAADDEATEGKSAPTALRIVAPIMALMQPVE